MANALEPLFEGDPDGWLDALKPHQTAATRHLLKEHADEESAAAAWLSATGAAENAPFGVLGLNRVFVDKLKGELFELLCGSERYNKEREELVKTGEMARLYVVGVLSAAIAPTLGSSAVFIAPAVALMLVLITKMTLRAWCAAQPSSDS